MATALNDAAISAEAAPAIPASTFRMAGPDAWLGRLVARHEVTDLVVLRPIGSVEREPPVDARRRLALAAEVFSTLKSAAVEAICDARSQGRSVGANLNNWRIVETRIDREGRLWLGLYEHFAGSRDIWMVEFDDQNKSSGVWRRQKREDNNLADCGQRFR